MKVLIVKLGAIGDIVHTLPALALLRRSLPGALIDWVAEERSAGILKNNSLIDRLIEVDTRSIRSEGSIEEKLAAIKLQAKELRRRRYDLAIDMQGLLKSAMIAKGSGAARRVGFGRRHLREPSSRIFLTETVKLPEKIHVVQKNLMLAASAIGADAEGFKPEFPIAVSEAEKEEAIKFTELAGGPFAVLNPGGGWVTKLWHAEKYGSLADRLWNEKGIRPLVVTGPNETALAERVAAAGRSGKLISIQPGLKPYFELLKHADVYIGGDTGPTHLAVAAGTPVVGIFGPTEWWRNGSTDPDDICVERMDIGCRVDCHRRTCSKWICMDIDVETVFQAVERRLARAASIREELPEAAI